MTLIEAIEAGRAWAEREADVAVLSGPWVSTFIDAAALVEGDDEDRTLARACNEAAASRWQELCAAGVEVRP